MNIDSDRLVEETIEYFKNYNPSGNTGSTTIFDDLLNTAIQVEFIDNRNHSKYGVYIVDELITALGTNGDRQKMTAPYRIK